MKYVKIVIALFIFTALVTYTITSYLKKDDSDKAVSTTNTIIEQNNQIIIDFTQCNSEHRKIWNTFGATIVETDGSYINNCNLLYYPEDDPNRAISCSVPKTTGKLSFEKTQRNINFDSINRYCK